MPNTDLELIAGAMHEVARQQQAQAKIVQSQAELLSTQAELLISSSHALALIAGKIKVGGMPVEVVSAAAAPAAAEAKPAGRGRGRPAGSGKDTAVAAAAAATPEIDYGTLRDKLKEVFDTKGRDVSVGILGEFRAQKLSDVPVGEYRKFYDRCVAILGAGTAPAAADPLSLLD